MRRCFTASPPALDGTIATTEHARRLEHAAGVTWHARRRGPSPAPGRPLGRLLAVATASVGRDDGPPLRPLVATAPQGELLAAADLHRVEGCLHEAFHTVEGVDPAVLATLAGDPRAVGAATPRHRPRARHASTEVFGAADIPWLVMKGAGPGPPPLPGSRPAPRRRPRRPRRRQHFVRRPSKRSRPAGYRDLVAQLADGRLAPVAGAADCSPTAPRQHRPALARALRPTTSAVHPPRCRGAARARPLRVAVGGRQVRTLDPVDTLLHLGSPHHAIRWRPVDLAEGHRAVADASSSPMATSWCAGPGDPTARPDGRAGTAAERRRPSAFALPDDVIESLIGRSTVLVDRLVTAYPTRRSAPILARRHPDLSVATKSGPASTAADLAWIRRRPCAVDAGARRCHPARRRARHRLDAARSAITSTSSGTSIGWSAAPNGPACRRSRSGGPAPPTTSCRCSAAHEPQDDRRAGGCAGVRAPTVAVSGVDRRAWRPAGRCRRCSPHEHRSVVRHRVGDRPGRIGCGRRDDRPQPGVVGDGFGADVTPVLAHLDRRRALDVHAVGRRSAARRRHDPARRWRAGCLRADDLPALVELYRGYELASEATVWQVRGTLGRLLDRQRILVSEDDGRLVGAVVVSGPTEHWIAVDGLTVLPEHRGKRARLGARRPVPADRQ